MFWPETAFILLATESVTSPVVWVTVNKLVAPCDTLVALTVTPAVLKLNEPPDAKAAVPGW